MMSETTNRKHTYETEIIIIVDHLIQLPHIGTILKPKTTLI